jgi:hypothetical protein
METSTPIELLKNKLAELKSIPKVELHLITEYEKAILVLEFMGVKAFDDKVNKPNEKNLLDSNLDDEPKKATESYYERFMEGQKKNNKSK